MDSTLQLKYSKIRLRSDLYVGLAWLLFFAIYSYFFYYNYFNYGYLVIAVIYLGKYFYKKTKHYAIINNGVFTKTGFFPKHIKLDDITGIRYFNDEYILKRETSKIIVSANAIDKTAIEYLENLRSQINVPKS